MSNSKEYVSGEEKREAECAVAEEEAEHEQQLMQECQQSFSQGGGQGTPQAESKQLSENEISSAIDKEIMEDGENDDLV